MNINQKCLENCYYDNQICTIKLTSPPPKKKTQLRNGIKMKGKKESKKIVSLGIWVLES